MSIFTNLADRCEASPRPSNLGEINQAIHCAMPLSDYESSRYPASSGFKVVHRYTRGRTGTAHPPDYTTNFRDARRLIPDGWYVDSLGESAGTGQWVVILARVRCSTIFRARASTPELAVCAAGLRAREGRD